MAVLSAVLVLTSLGTAPPLPPVRPAKRNTDAVLQSTTEAVPLPRPRPVPPEVAIASDHGPPTDCDKRLAAMAVFAPKPTLAGPGACGGSDLIELDAVILADGHRVAVTPKAMLRCEMAESFAAWLRDEVAPKLKPLNSPLRAVENEDSYECRGRNRVVGAKVSEHGKGNAIDVRGFVLADHRTIVLTDVAEPKDMREDLRDSACHRFTTVLGPGSDAYHEQHIHFDVLERRAGYRICQWAVRMPPPPAMVAAGAPVPLPPPRPLVPETRKL